MKNDKKILLRNTRRLLGLIAFIATGGGLILDAMFTEPNFYKTEILVIFGCLYAISLADHFRKLRKRDDED